MIKYRIAILIVWAIIGLVITPAESSAQHHLHGDSDGDQDMNLFSRTFGGKQFWTDVEYCGGWRVQENATTGHCRLLDPDNVRHTFGPFEVCQQALKELIQSKQAVPCRGRVVVVLHGLIRTTESMRLLGEYLQTHGDFTSVNFEYASTRRPIAEHAAALDRLIQSLGSEVTEINFVAHSLGNIVVRHYLADLQADGRCEPRFRRMVMIGPPNQGSKMAAVLRRSLVFNSVTGPSGYELGGGWKKLEPRLATPDFEFGIIAGGQVSKRSLSNFFLIGPDDFTVSLDETKLVGARDFLVKPLMHSTMMRKPVTIQATLQFLNHGYFVSDQHRHPIVSLDETLAP